MLLYVKNFLRLRPRKCSLLQSTFFCCHHCHCLPCFSKLASPVQSWPDLSYLFCLSCLSFLSWLSSLSSSVQSYQIPLQSCQILSICLILSSLCSFIGQFLLSYLFIILNLLTTLPLWGNYSGVPISQAGSIKRIGWNFHEFLPYKQDLIRASRVEKWTFCILKW